MPPVEEPQPTAQDLALLREWIEQGAPGAGNRYAYFDTTSLAHALGQTTYTVRELAPGEVPLPNGLPVFPILYQNDDDGLARLGKDSRLTFVAPVAGEYFVRIRDARGFGGDDYKYQLTLRQPQPDFQPSVTGAELKLPVQSGREWSVAAQRIDGLDGEISIELSGLPEGVIATNPLKEKLEVSIDETPEVQLRLVITAAPKVAPGRRQFHLRSTTAGNPTSRPIWLNVVSY